MSRVNVLTGQDRPASSDMGKVSAKEMLNKNSQSNMKLCGVKLYAL